MKIDTDLRLAIKAAVRQHNETKCDWTTYRNDQSEAIKKLVSSPKYRAKIKRASAQIKVAASIKEKAQMVFDNLGINYCMDRIYDDGKFEAAGGAVITKNKTLDVDSILADIAKADKKQADKIIKDLGIKWE